MHPFQRQKQRRGAVLHDLAADQPGPAAKRHDADAGGGTGADHSRDFLNVMRGGQQPGMAMIAAARFFQMARLNLSQHALRQSLCQRRACRVQLAVMYCISSYPASVLPRLSWRRLAPSTLGAPPPIDLQIALRDAFIFEPRAFQDPARGGVVRQAGGLDPRHVQRGEGIADDRANRLGHIALPGVGRAVQ